MTGVAVEQMLELWCVELRQVKAHLKSLFAHPSVATSAAAFLDGLLGPERRKTGWMRAEAAGDRGPWRQQAVLGRSHWEADALRDMVRDYALETLASPGAVLVIDETGFLKQGQRSCGVGRQYTGSAGKITNCQIGVFAAYVFGQGLRLHRPSALSAQGLDQQPRAPGRRSCARQHPLCHQTRDRRRDDRAGSCSGRTVRLGGGRHDLWCGSDRDAAAPRRQGLCAGRACHRSVLFLDRQTRSRRHGRADRARLAPQTWKRLSAGDGTKGPRLYDWAYLELADLAAEEYNEELTGLWTRGLLIRRRLSDGDLAFFSTWCPAGTPMETLVRVEGQRWAIEDAFETAKTELGLDPQRDPLVAGLAPACLAGDAGLCHDGSGAPARQQPDLTPKKKRRGQLQRWCAGLSRKSAAWPHASSNADRARLRDRLVRLATSASGDGTSLTPQTKGATVMLGVWWRNVVGTGCVGRLRTILGASMARGAHRCRWRI